MKNKNNSPLNQDSKFDTSLHDYGRRAHTMSPKERSDYRTGMGHALTFTPVGGALGIAGKAAGIVARNIGGGARAIGQGLVRKFGTKGMKKTYDKVFPRGASQQTMRAEHIIPRGKVYTTTQIKHSPGPAHASRSQDLGLHKATPKSKPAFNYPNRVAPKVKTMSGLTPKVKTYDMKVSGQQSAPKTKFKSREELLKEREILNQRPSQQYSLPKIVEGGVELGRGDLKRRGITPGPYGGYYKRTQAGKSFRHPWSM